MVITRWYLSMLIIISMNDLKSNVIQLRIIIKEL